MSIPFGLHPSCLCACLCHTTGLKTRVDKNDGRHEKACCDEPNRSHLFVEDHSECQRMADAIWEEWRASGRVTGARP
jgi:hypothetical protein